MKSFFCCLFLVSLVFASSQEERYRNYLDYIQRYELLGPVGCYDEGEIELILDLDVMREVEGKTGREVGVVYEDRYWIWLNDAVIFPGGRKGVYGRMVWKSGLEGPSGVAVLPLRSDGKIVLNCMFRHSTRCWALEIPRGMTDHGEAPLQTARRELGEETGWHATSIEFLGEVTPETGMVGSSVCVYLAHLSHEENQQAEDSEAIAKTISLTPNEIRHMLSMQRKTGGKPFTWNINGHEKDIYLRDPYLTFALFQYEMMQRERNSIYNRVHKNCELAPH